jgi:hypothetical protein
MIPVSEPSNARVSSPSLSGSVDSKPFGGMDVCLLWVLCCQVVSATVDPSSRGAIQTGVCSRNLKNEASLARVGILRKEKIIATDNCDCVNTM